MNISDVYGLECIYCGEPASQRDHVIPHSVVNGTDASRTYDHADVVPACRDCNGALTNKPLLTISERATWLHQRMERKLAKMNRQQWTEEEISALGKTLQAYVRREQSKLHEIERRLAHLTSVKKLSCLNPDFYWILEGRAA